MAQACCFCDPRGPIYPASRKYYDCDAGAVLLIVCNAKPRDEARAVPDLKVAFVEHFLGFFDSFLIGLTNDRARPCDLVANRQFVNPIIGGRSHARNYVTARREVESQKATYSIVSWEMLAKLGLGRPLACIGSPFHFTGENLPGNSGREPPSRMNRSPLRRSRDCSVMYDTGGIFAKGY
jgi:hypothetical protein